MQLVNGRQLIDQVGNIYTHGRSGFSIIYQQQIAGVFQDISTLALFFEISDVARIGLGAGADNTQRTLIVESAIVQQLPLREPTPFALRDETGDPATVRWDGYITVRGYQGTPP